MQGNENGKILRVKTGYNPNSSSIGSQIPAFLAFAVGTGVASLIVSQIFSIVRDKTDKEDNSAHKQADK